MKCPLDLPMMVLQMSNAYLDKSMDTEEIKYAVPEMTIFSSSALLSII